MKQFIFILSYLIFCANLFSNTLELEKLENEYLIIERKIEKKKIQEKISFSELEVMKLNKNLISKKIEVINKIADIKKKYYDKKYKIEKNIKLIKFTEIKIDKLKQYLSYVEKESISTSELELKELKLNIMEQSEKLTQYRDNLKYYQKYIKSPIKISKEQWLENGLDSELELAYKSLYTILERELKILKANKKSKYKIENKEIELKNSELAYNMKIKENLEEKNKLILDRKNLNRDIKTLKQKIILNSEKLKLLKKQMKSGLFSLSDYLEEEIKLLNTKIELVEKNRNYELKNIELEIKEGR